MFLESNKVNKSLKYLKLALFTCTLSSTLIAQNLPPESTDSLTTVDVFAAPYREQQTQADRIEQGGASAAIYLEKLGNAHLSSYAPGAVTSLSLGGAQSTHTQALWHNLPLTSYASGALDLTLVPAVLLQPASFKSGTAGNSQASNSLSGSYQLALSHLDTGYTTQLSGNSLGYRSLSVRGSGALLKGSYTGYVRRYQSANNYPYQLGNVQGRVEGMDFSGTDFVQEFSFKDGLIHHDFGWWLTESFKNNSGSVLVSRVPSQLHDRTARLFYSLQYLQHTLSVGFNNEWQNFVDQEFNLNDTNTYRHGSTSYRWGSKKWLLQWDQQFLLAGGTSRSAQLYVPSWTVTRRWKRGYTKLLMLHQRQWHWGASQHVEYKKGGRTAYAQLGTYVRLPTLNDLYWQPGGNPSLKAERSYGARLGYSKTYATSAITSYIEPMLYENLIQWTPNSSGIWSPQNVKEVVAATAFVQVRKEIGALENTLEAGYYFNRILRSALPNDASVGKRTVYTPLYKAVLTSEWNLRRAGALQWRTTLLGSRYTSRDNSSTSQLPAQLQTDLLWSWISKNHQVTFLAGAKNLTNSNVQYFPYFPMPGRHFTMELSLSTKP